MMDVNDGIGGLMATDCGFEKGGEWFRYRAAAIIIEEGCVLFVSDGGFDY